MPDDTVGGMPQEQLSGETTVSGSGQTQGAENKPEKQGETPKQEAQATIDWAKIDPTTIPADVLKQHPEFRKVVDESISRRKENQRLKKALAAEDGDAGAEPDEQKPTTPQEEITQLMAEWREFKNAQAEREAANLRERVAVEAGLPKEWANRLIGKTEAELQADAKLLAAALPKKPNFGGDTSPANFGSADAQAALTARVKDRMSETLDLNKPSRAFSPGTHRQKGGGPLRN